LCYLVHMPNDNTLIISDVHIPYHCADALPFLEAVANQINADRVICVGDLLDAHGIAPNYEPHPDALSPGNELKASQAYVSDFARVFPEMWVCTGNHEYRVHKAAQKARLPSDLVRPLSEVFDTPGWTWGDDWWIESALGPVCVTHGDKKKGALAYARLIGASVVQGHWHNEFALQFQNSRNRVFFGMDIGCLADADSLALAYAKRAPLGQMLGCGAIVDGWPRLFAMEVGIDNRWTGRLI